MRPLVVVVGKEVAGGAIDGPLEALGYVVQ